jgi:hypothetical protein
LVKFLGLGDGIVNQGAIELGDIPILSPFLFIVSIISFLYAYGPVTSARGEA